jgi:hypothetical protein
MKTRVRVTTTALAGLAIALGAPAQPTHVQPPPIVFNGTNNSPSKN